MNNESSKTVVITGASSGIGLSIAREFCNRNYRVFGSVRKQEDAQRLQSELGEGFTPLIMDVTKPEEIKKSAEVVDKELDDKGLNGLINNAGVGFGGPLQHMPMEEIRTHFDVNVLGLIEVTQAFLPMLGARKSHNGNPGRIVNISSVAGKVAAPFLAPYVGTKHAVEGISKSLRRELLLFGIDVIVIGPGSVSTPIWDKSAPPEKYEHTGYYKALKNFAEFFIREGKNGDDPSSLASKIVNAFEKNNPKPRYAIVKGKLKNWTIPNLLPTRMLDKIIGKSTGLLKDN